MRRIVSRFLRGSLLSSLVAISAVTLHAQEATFRMAVGGPYAPVRALAISPDGDRMFIGGGFDTGPYTSDRRIGDGKLYDVATLRVIASLDGLTRPVFTSAFSHNGRYLVTGGGIPDDDTPGKGELCLWDAESGALLRRFYGVMPVRAVGFSPDDAWVIVRSPSNMTLWQVGTGSMVDNIDTGSWNTCAITPDGQYYAVAYSGTEAGVKTVTTELRQLPYASVRRRYIDTTDDVTALAFELDGRRLASATGDTIRLRNLDNGDMLGQFVKSGARFTSLSISDDGAYLAAGDASTDLIYVWRIATGEMLLGAEAASRGAFAFHGGAIRSVRFLPDGRLLTGADDHTARIWTVPAGLHVRSLTAPHRERVTSLSFSRDGQWVASVAHDSTLIIWDTQNLRPLQSAPVLLGAPVRRVQFLPEGEAVAAVAGSTLYRVSAMSGMVTSLGTLTAGAASAISSDGRLVAVGTGRIGDGGPARVVLHELALGAAISRTLSVEEDSVTSVTFATDGSRLLASTRSALYCWDVTSGEQLWRKSTIGQVASAGGRELMTAGTWTTMRDLTTGDSLGTLPISGTTAAGMSLTNDGRYAVAVDARGTLRRWNIRSGDTLPDLKSRFALSLVAVSPDSKLVAAAAYDGTIALWNSGLSIGAAAPTEPTAVLSPDAWASVRPIVGGTGRVDRVEAVLSAPADGAVELYDALGARVAELARGEMEAGSHSFTLPTGLPSGVYFCRIVTGRAVASCKLAID